MRQGTRWGRLAGSLVAAISLMSSLLVLSAPPAPANTAPSGAAGSLDTTFGSGGIASVSVPLFSLMQVTKLLVQPDGKIVVAGLQPGTAASVTVARFTSSGALDTAFGAGKGYVQPGLGSTSTSDGANIALQPDGKIVVVGSQITGSGPNLTTLVAATRLNTDGSVDTSFGTAGTATANIGGSPLVHGSSATVLSTGQVVVSAWAGSSGNFTLVRFTSAGKLDSTFGSGGIAQATTAQGPVETNDLVVTSAGQIIAVGFAKVSGQNDTAVARFNANGTPDTTFPSGGAKNGTATLDIGKGVTDQGNTVALDAAGNIVVAGTVSSSPSKAFVLRLLANGTVDSSFGSAGVLSGTFGGAQGTGSAIVQDAAGRYLSVGGDGPSTGSTNAIGVERLTSTGGYDGAFGLQSTPGRETVSCANSAAGAGTSVALPSASQILVGGNCNGALEVARLNVGNISNLTMTTTTPTAPAGHAVVPLSSIPPGALAANASIVSGGFSLAGSPLGGGPLGGGPLGGGPLGGGPLGGGPLGGGPLGGGPLGGGPLGGGPFSAPSLGAIALSSIPLVPPATWTAVLAGTSCASFPLQSLTLQFVESTCPTAIQGLVDSSINIDATPLRTVSLGSFALGLTPASALPGACSFLANQAANCSNNPASTSLVDFELKGDTLSTYFATTTINVNGTAINAQAPVVNAPLYETQLSDTTLGPVTTSSLAHPSNFVSCQPSSCPTLAAAQAQNAIVPSATVGSLIADSPAAVGPVPFATLLIGMVPRAALPVEQLPASTIVGSAPSPSATSGAAYQVDFDLGCGGAPGLTVTPSLPSGFSIIPASASMTVGGAATPVTVNTSGANPTITPTSPVSCSGTQHVTVKFNADPPAVLGGPYTSGASVTTNSDSASVTGKASVTVGDNCQPDESSSPQSMSADTLYLCHIPTAGDVDYFSIAPPPAGSVITVSLRPAVDPTTSKSTQDYDLVLYGPALPQLRGSPLGGGPLGGGPLGGGPLGGGPLGGGPLGGGPLGGGALITTDTSTAPTSNGSATPPEVLTDVPLLAGQTVRGFSTQRGTANESTYSLVTDTDTSPFLVQVSGFNGASSPDPYVVRVTITGPRPTLPCASRSFPGGGSAGSLPSTPLPSGTQTLILLNKARIGNAYGNDPATGLDWGSEVYNAAQTLASRADVKGVVVPVEGDSGVASAYSAWDSSPCSIGAANNVVSSINKLVDKLRSGLNDLRSIVLVGADEMLPQGRIPDGAGLFNERGFGAAVATHGMDNAESRALSAGYLLSDNPYGDFAPTTVGSSQLFVPQAAVGRLVETPSDIVGAINQYISANGVISPSASFVTGYDFMSSAAAAINGSLAPRVPAGTSSSKISSSWSRADAITGINSAAHGFVALNAHYDYSRSLPASEFSSGSTASLLTTSDTDLPSNLSGAVLMTMGCHSGLNVPDMYISNPTQAESNALFDWPQFATRRGAVEAGQTGYGLGDTDVVAYSARLMTLFAQNLDGSMTVGQALAFAKQQYFHLGAASVYDVKAIHEATFYGLPFWRLSINGAPGNEAPSAVPPPPSQTQPPLSTATTSQSFSDTLVSHSDQGGRGSYYVDKNSSGLEQPPEVVPNEPIEPRTEIPLANRTDGLVAHSAVIESLSTADLSGFNPVIDTPIADLANTPANPTVTSTGEPAVTSAAFPSALQNVVSSFGPSGRQDTLVFLPGQFASDGSGTGTGIQRLVKSANMTVYYSNSYSFAEPRISTVSGSVSGTTATFTVTTPDTDVTRGILLMLTSGGAATQSWTHVELVNAGNGKWVGTASVPSGTTQVGQYFVQLVNQAGNVGQSSNKGVNYSAGVTTGNFSFSINATPNSSGLYPNPTTVTITPPSGVTSYSVSVDGGTATTVTGTDSITFNTDGAHSIVVTAPDGTTSAASIPIDSHPPAITITTPPNGAVYALNQSVTSSFSCTSTVKVTSCAGPAQVDTSSGGNHTFTVTATDQFGLASSASTTYLVDVTPPSVTLTQTPANPTNQTSATFAFSASDPDNAASTLKLDCTLDGGTTASCSSPVAYSGLANGSHTVVIRATDPAGNIGSTSYTWRVDTTPPTVTFSQKPSDPTDQTTAHFAYTVSDPDAGDTVTVTCAFDGSPTSCTSTSADLSNVAVQTAAHSFSVTAKDAAGNTTTASVSWHVYYDTNLVASPVVRNVPTYSATLRYGTGATAPGSGSGLSGQEIDFYAGQSGPNGNGKSSSNFLCSGTTDSTGKATCTSSSLTAAAQSYLTGVTAVFVQNPPYLGSTGTAGVLS